MKTCSHGCLPCLYHQSYQWRCSTRVRFMQDLHFSLLSHVKFVQMCKYPWAVFVCVLVFETLDAVIISPPEFRHNNFHIFRHSLHRFVTTIFRYLPLAHLTTSIIVHDNYYFHHCITLYKVIYYTHCELTKAHYPPKQRPRQVVVGVV